MREPNGDGRMAHHATPQWQSFEVRMVARKAERCLERAAAALDEGSITEAVAALEEARALAPLHPRLEELRGRLEAAENPPPVLEKIPTRTHTWTAAAAAAAAGLAFFSAIGWQAWIHRDQLSLLMPRSQPEIDAGSGLSNLTTVSVPSSDASRTSSQGATRLTGESNPSSVPGSGQASTSGDTVVQTTLVRAERVMGIQPDHSESTRNQSVVAAVDAGRTADKEVDAARLPVAPTGSTGTRPQSESTAPPVSAEYRPDLALPAASAAVPAANFTAAAAPEPPRPSSTTGRTSTPIVATDSSSSASTPVNAAANPASSSTVPPPSASPAARDERVAVRAALSQYESAYNRLDIEAVRSVWPTLDQRALSRAFDSLTAQRLSLRTCNVDVSGSTARANCAGSASWTPKVGGGQRTSALRWTFDLSQADGAWRIEHVQAR